MAVRETQYAALPWRDTGSGIEVLLITSRETRRWVIPKGWPIKGLTPSQAAAREAYEEAGVGGLVTGKAAGSFDYDKRGKDDEVRPCHVLVFPLEVMVQHIDWPEQGQRTLRWMSQEDAAAAVAEPQLASLIRRLK